MCAFNQQDSRRALFKSCNVGRVQVIERNDIKGSKTLMMFPQVCNTLNSSIGRFFHIIDSCAKILVMFMIFSLVFIDSFHLVLIFITWQLPLFSLLSILSCGQITHSHFCFFQFLKYYFLNFSFCLDSPFGFSA